MDKIRVGIIGATGYAGLELVRLLLNHPLVTLTAVSSVSFEGKAISEIYPTLTGIFEQTLVTDDAVLDACEVIFGSMPAGLSEPLARKAVDAGHLFIDLGADFRLTEEADYQSWYDGAYVDKPLHAAAVYSIPELHRDRLIGKKVKLIGNPGCYPTSIALGLAPAAKAGALRLDTLVIDSKSGSTGAGRGLTLTTHHAECNEAFSPYKIASHRHTPEIEQTLSELTGTRPFVTFVPHLLPVNRGILSTIYAAISDGFDYLAIRALYAAAYHNEPFVQLLPDGAVANLKSVKYSNQCHISLHHDPRTNRLIVVSAIDNMVKGAAGQAIQNMNLALGFEETTGLALIPPAF